MSGSGDLVDVGDTRLWVETRGAGMPVFLLHGGPGLDHHMFGDYLDPLTERGYRLLLVDQREQGASERGTDPASWTLEQLARDVSALAGVLGHERYAVLGHSYGAFVALQHAVDAPGAAVATVVSSGVPASRYLADVEANLAAFEPVELRDQVTASWAAEAEARTEADVAALLADQLPFHFADPRDPRIADYARRTTGMRGSPDVIRAGAAGAYGGIDVEDRLGDVTQPVLVLAGTHDRTCSVAAARTMADRLPSGQLEILPNTGHMTFVEETERYLSVVGDFLDAASAA